MEDVVLGAIQIDGMWQRFDQSQKG